MLGLLVFSNVSLIHCNVQKLRDAVHELESEGGLDPRELSSLIDRLQAVLCRALYEGSKRGDHLLTGQTTCAWVATTCRLSGPAASDRLCVGEQLEAMPQVAQALGRARSATRRPRLSATSARSCARICGSSATKSNGSAMPKRTRSKIWVGWPTTSAMCSTRMASTTGSRKIGGSAS